MSLMQKAECDNPEVMIGRAHRIGKGYVGKNSKELCKSIIVSFSTFKHRIVMLKLNLIWQRPTIFKEAIETAKQSNVVDYVMIDINCRLKVVFKNGRSKFLTDSYSLKHAKEEKEIN